MNKMKRGVFIALSLIVSHLPFGPVGAQIPFVKGRVVNQSLSEMHLQRDSVTMTFATGTEHAAMGDVEVAFGQVHITEAQGWLESACVMFEPFPGAKSYHVYVKGGQYADYTLLDAQLVRNYGSYGRADAVGLSPASDYQLRVVPVDTFGTEISAAASQSEPLTVVAHDRAGFAHFGLTEGIGAYQNDGTLKKNARVVYVTHDNAKTVSLDIISDKKGTKTTTYTGLQQIIYGYQKGYDTRPLCIRLVGTIAREDCDELLSSAEGLQVKGASGYQPMNITIEGIGNDATITGFGILVRNCASVEMRNFAVMLCMDDAISFDTKNEHAWIHHLDLFYGQPGSDADQKKGDGTVDLKADSRYVTVSYCHFWDTGKSSLCGMKSETGPNYITYHHNWFDHSDSRHARVRTMSVHMYNNYFDQVSKYGVGATTGASVFMENNYFHRTKKPILCSRQGTDALGGGTFSGENGGMIKAFGNYFDTTTPHFSYYTQTHPASTGYDAYETATRQDAVPSTETARAGGTPYDNFDTNPQLMYTYTADEASQVPAIVTGALGAGRMGHGDVRHTFADNTGSDDADSALDTTMKSILQNYTSSFVGFF